MCDRIAIVTGATSMIGVALIKELIKNNVKVIAIVRQDSKRIERLPDSSLLTVVECDIDDNSEITRKCRKVLSGENPDVFYHFAWKGTGKDQRDDADLQLENIETTLSCVDVAYKLGCKRFVGAGSQAEYGRQNRVMCTDCNVTPDMSYGIAKYAAGRLAEKKCKNLGIEFVWGRIFSVYGLNDNDGTMIMQALNCYYNGGVMHFSSGIQYWDYLNVADAGRAFYLLGTHPEATGYYNVASGEQRVLRNYIDDLIEVFGEKFQYDIASDSDNNNYGIRADVARLICIGFEPKVGFREGINQIMSIVKN